MSAPASLPPVVVDRDYTLEHKYTREEGRIYLSGVQALVRLPLMQQMRDRAAGANTAGFISGYRGSPLGGFDLELWKARKHLKASAIEFTDGYVDVIGQMVGNFVPADNMLSGPDLVNPNLTDQALSVPANAGQPISVAHAGSA